MLGVPSDSSTVAAGTSAGQTINVTCAPRRSSGGTPLFESAMGRPSAGLREPPDIVRAWFTPDQTQTHIGTLPATLPATAVTLGPMGQQSWTRAARGTDPECPGATPWTARGETFNPRVLGSNPSRLTNYSPQWAAIEGFSRSGVVFPQRLTATLTATAKARGTTS